jgi:hypothetical protein
VIAILSVSVLFIFTAIKIAREEILKHEQPYSGTGIGHGGGMA